MILFIEPIAASFIARLISSSLGGFSITKVMSVIEPFGTGTRTPHPPIFPSNSGNIRANAFAAPVVVGTMDSPAARALL